MNKTVEISLNSILKNKLSDYNQLAKLRLTISVVLSAVLGFIIAANSETNFYQIIPLSIGGFFLVASSNSLNQVIEKEFDKLMLRTQNRPVAQNRITIQEALVFSIITGVLGVWLLGFYLNKISAILGLSSLAIYAFVYTPLKRYSRVSVLIGAIPGAIPPLLGWASATGELSYGAWALFFIQFFWQFPHFWSIAWILNEDYNRAGYNLLPDNKGITNLSVNYIRTTTIIMVICSSLPYFLNITGLLSLAISLSIGFYMIYYSFILNKNSNISKVKFFMFISILYNILVLLSYSINKI